MVRPILESRSMLKAYSPHNGELKVTDVAGGAVIPSDALWLDLLQPTDAERQAVGHLLGLEMPTHADMEEIEVSSRLYSEAGSTVMTVLILANSESEQPTADVVTFVLTNDK